MINLIATVLKALVEKMQTDSTPYCQSMCDDCGWNGEKRTGAKMVWLAMHDGRQHSHETKIIESDGEEEKFVCPA